jgi:hypothetical protein
MVWKKERFLFLFLLRLENDSCIELKKREMWAAKDKDFLYSFKGSIT